MIKTMNKLLKVFTVFLVGLIGYACSPEEHELATTGVGSDELVEGIAFSIEHDEDNPNIIYLTSLMDSRFTPLWNHPQGRSQAQKVTLKIPFPGTYTVKFGVQTRGGAVFGEETTFTIDDFYAPFVEDELWTLLSGGVDEEKTWYLDLDADALSRNFLGPLYFYGTNNGWLGACMLEGGDCWNWNPDYKGNSWLMGAADFGSMTFDLKGAANVSVTHNTIPGRGTETGTYLLDADAKTLKMTDASPLHDSGRDGQVIDWGNITILSLTEDFMQLAVLRDPALSGEGACLLVYNFISKDYYDNWVPGEVVEPEPPYSGNPNEDLTTSVTTKKKWTLSLNTPYNWAGLDGAFLNNWNSPADYAATGWAPYDASLIANISLTLDKTGPTAGNYEFTDGGGNIIDGTYTIDATNHIVFDQAISINVSGWVNMETTPEHKLRLIRTDVDPLGNISKMWLGKRDPTKPEYQVFGFEPVAAGPADPMAAWKSALVGKTFTHDINYFADWVGLDWSGGWTGNGSALFTTPDFVAQSWFWNQTVRDAAVASSVSFYLEGGNIKANAIDNGVAKNGISVTIDTENATMTFSEAPLTYTWIYTNNTSNTWIVGSRDGANLGNIPTKGLYLGFASGPAEITMVHWVLD
jgi:hypothetical protein